MSANFNLLTGRENNELVEYQGYLVHHALISSLEKLQRLVRKELGADMQIISSFRNYERQTIIWNEKLQGIRKVFDDNENIVNKNDYPTLEYLHKVMRFSAIPGASRHHWGTDLDIYDANQINKKDVQLTASECNSGGPCYKLHTFLDELITGHNSFGFFRPYEKDLGGVAVEKWHLSYAPIAQEFFEKYDLACFEKNIERSKIEAKELILKNSEEIYQRYISNITFP